MKSRPASGSFGCDGARVGAAFGRLGFVRIPRVRVRGSSCLGFVRMRRRPGWGSFRPAWVRSDSESSRLRFERPRVRSDATAPEFGQVSAGSGSFGFRRSWVRSGSDAAGFVRIEFGLGSFGFQGVRVGTAFERLGSVRIRWRRVWSSFRPARVCSDCRELFIEPVTSVNGALTMLGQCLVRVVHATVGIRVRARAGQSARRAGGGGWTGDGWAKRSLSGSFGVGCADDPARRGAGRRPASASPRGHASAHSGPSAPCADSPRHGTWQATPGRAAPRLAMAAILAG